MNQFTKFVQTIFFLLISSSLNAAIETPFENMIVNKEPVEYKNIVFEDFNGNTINLNTQEAQFFFLNFWATWCLPCKEEMPYLDKLQNFNGIKVFPINVENNNKLKTEIFFKSLEIKNLSIYFDIETNLVNLFRLIGIPTTIILNKEKKEIARVIGTVDFSDKKFIEWLKNYSN